MSEGLSTATSRSHISVKNYIIMIRPQLFWGSVAQLGNLLS
jgi:hypothetical protein